jgi:signal transduction histidine kinase
MHPVLVAGRRLAMYLSAWLLVGVLLAIGVGQGMGLVGAVALFVPLGVLYAFVGLSAWYLCRAFPIERNVRPWRLLGVQVLAGAVTSAIWAAVGEGWAAVLSQFPDNEGLATAFGERRPLVYVVGILLFLLAAAFHYVLIALEASREAETRALAQDLLAREAELKAIRMQIDPHFLFNSLHSISALTAIDPQAARRMTIQLGQFLRDTLAVGSKARIPLARELQLAERYLEIERVRFGDRLQVEVDAGGADRCLVPPLLLQPLVENAVTHGIAQAIGGGTIRLAAWTTSGSLRIRVENPCDPDRPRRTGTGVGLSNVRARLTALHGDAAWVTAAEAEGAWRVEIALPLAVAEPAEQAVGS